jgi:pantothenate synthetase (EC 6.3.2.1)
MVADFALPIEIVGGDTMRANDGLALSSRNGFLSASERQSAPQLYQSLMDLKAQILNGADDFSQLERSAQDRLVMQGWHVDYVAIRTPELTLPAIDSRRLVILAAARLGQTRLIDNIEIER